jgi:hypothetical protein
MSAKSENTSSSVAGRRVWRRLRLLLLLPFAAVLWVPVFDRIDPGFFRVPFVHWYQLFWAVVSAALVYLVYRLEN